MSPVRIVPHGGFRGGLDLRASVYEEGVGRAIDARNVRLGPGDVLQPRLGSRKLVDFGTTRVGSQVNLVGGYAAHFDYYVICTEDELRNVRSDGTALFNLAHAGGSVAKATQHSTAIIGTPGQAYVHVASDGHRVREIDVLGNITSTGVSVDGAAAAGDMGNGWVVGVTPWDGRLLYAGFRVGTHGPGAQPVDPAIIYASDGYAPRNLAHDSFFRVGAGDGEEIIEIVTWREMVFIFKETKFYVFTGIGTDNSGGPLFRRRPVETGLGAVAAHGVAVGEDGVYFFTGRDVYRTTGDVPELVSEPVTPLLRGIAVPFCSHGLLHPADRSKVALTCHGRELYVNYPEDGDTWRDVQLVLNTRTGAWMLDTREAAMMGVDAQGRLIHTSHATNGGHYAIFAQSDDPADVDECGMTTDAGVAASWRSAFMDFGNVEPKVHAALRVWGQGTIDVGVTRDFSDSPSAGGGYTILGLPLSSGLTRPLDGRMKRRALSGSAFSTELSGFRAHPGDPPWSVHRLTHYLREAPVPTALRTQR